MQKKNSSRQTLMFHLCFVLFFEITLETLYKCVMISSGMWRFIMSQSWSIDKRVPTSFSSLGWMLIWIWGLCQVSVLTHGLVRVSIRTQGLGQVSLLTQGLDWVIIVIQWLVFQLRDIINLGITFDIYCVIEKWVF